MVVQIFGQKGMLGSAVLRKLPQTGLQWHPHQADLELVTAGHIHADVVINCAGLVKQRQAPDSRFMLVNGVGPHRLAEACDQVGARLIHVSTDCMFHRHGPHSELSRIDAGDVYARSKLAGEVTRAPHLTIRTSFVGWGKRGLLHDLQGLAPVKASAYLFWSGHTVDTVADVLLALAARSDISGLLHVPGDWQSRYELCYSLKARFELPAPIDRDDHFQGDRRLDSLRWHMLDLPDLPSFAQQLEAMEGPPQ